MKLNIKIKVNDLKLAMLVIVSLFILGQAFLTLAEEINNPGNLFLDSDQDGLSDEEEKAYGTNPFVADTDEDGYSDGAEVKSGYNPLKPAPGDKLATVEKTADIQPQASAGAKENLTDLLAKQVSSTMNLADNQADPQEITTDNIETLTQNFLNNQTDLNQTLPSISLDDVTIKRQDYSDLSTEETQKKKQEDFSNYVVSIFYILSLNSEKPIVTTQNFDNAAAELIKEIFTATQQSDLNYFNNLEQKSQKIMDEMKNIEVPEEFLESHLKMLSLIKYGLSLKNLIVKQPDDPALNLINLSKIQSFWSIYDETLSEIVQKTQLYELDTDYIKTKLEKLGIDTSGAESNYSSAENSSFDLSGFQNSDSTSLLNSTSNNE